MRIKNTITSLQNPKIKLALQLRKTNARRKNDLILVEGYPEIILAAQSGLTIETLFYAAELARPDNRPEKIMCQETIGLSAAGLRKISYRDRPDGFLALVRPQYYDLSQIALSTSPLLIVIEAGEKPGNLGAVLRTADAAGADAVILCDPAVDLYNPNAIRASRGAVFSVPTAATVPAEAVEWLKSKEIKIYAAIAGPAKNYTAVDWRGPAAIAIGAEHAGLSPLLLRAADEKITIPMKGRVDSLNASVSAAVIIYEAVRQRSRK